VAIITPKLNFQNSDTMQSLRDRVTKVQGVDEVRMSRTLLPITRNTATIISTPIIEAICPTSPVSAASRS
jgi:hypothetical protein